MEFMVIPALGILLGLFAVWTSHTQKLAKYELEMRTHGAGGGAALRLGQKERM